MAIWHLMFHKPDFEIEQVRHVVTVLDEAKDFGGFPINHVGLIRDTDDMLYVDLDFKLTSDLTQPTFEQMAKYMLVLTGFLERAPLPLYFEIMQRSLSELDVTYYVYPDHRMDLFYWQAPPVSAPPQSGGLRFK